MYHKHYVYAHVDEFEYPMYIGIGVQGRAWEIKKRDGCHRNWLNEQEHAYVQLWDTHLTRDEALKLERRYIRDNDTKFNIQCRER